MEFKFAVNDVFKQPIIRLGNNLVPPGFTGDRRAFWDVVGKVTEVVNAMGEASAAAQGLTKPITTAERLRNSEHMIYLLVDKDAGNGRGAVTGMLKTGKKGLYVFDRNGQHYQVSPPCVLDFYVHESRQRTGLGKRLFEHMLQAESIEPVKMAIDRPSEKFLGFLNKHYALSNPVKQMNNYVVFDDFFPSSPEKNNAVEPNHSVSTPGKKQSANGLQTSSFTSPLGRYGAPRPPCSMGQIIHNQSSTISKTTEPTGVEGVKSAPETSLTNPTSLANPTAIQSAPNAVQSAPDIYYQPPEQKLNGIGDQNAQAKYYQQQQSNNMWQSLGGGNPVQNEGVDQAQFKRLNPEYYDKQMREIAQNQSDKNNSQEVQMQVPNSNVPQYQGVNNTQIYIPQTEAVPTQAQNYSTQYLFSSTPQAQVPQNQNLVTPTQSQYVQPLMPQSQQMSVPSQAMMQSPQLNNMMSYNRNVSPQVQNMASYTQNMVPQTEHLGSMSENIALQNANMAPNTQNVQPPTQTHNIPASAQSMVLHAQNVMPQSQIVPPQNILQAQPIMPQSQNPSMRYQQLDNMQPQLQNSVAPQIQNLQPAQSQAMVAPPRNIATQMQNITPQIQNIVPQTETFPPYALSIQPQAQTTIPQVRPNPSLTYQTQNVQPQLQEAIQPQLQGAIQPQKTVSYTQASYNVPQSTNYNNIVPVQNVPSQRLYNTHYQDMGPQGAVGYSQSAANPNLPLPQQNFDQLQEGVYRNMNIQNNSTMQENVPIYVAPLPSQTQYVQQYPSGVNVSNQQYEGMAEKVAMQNQNAENEVCPMHAKMLSERTIPKENLIQSNVNERYAHFQTPLSRPQSVRFQPRGNAQNQGQSRQDSLKRTESSNNAKQDVPLPSGNASNGDMRGIENETLIVRYGYPPQIPDALKTAVTTNMISASGP